MKQKDQMRSQKTSVDMKQLKNAFAILANEIEAKRIPGAVSIVGTGNRIIDKFASGKLMTDGTVNNYVDEDTMFDCASLTKVVITMPLVLKLIEQGEIELSEPVSTYISVFEKGDKSLINIRHLLTHTSGLKPHVSKDFTNWKPEEVKEYIYSVELDSYPGERVIYSDVGFIVLGDIIEIILNKPLDKAAEEYIMNPIGMEDTYYNPPKHLKSRIAATEFRTDLGRYQWGEVHDEKAQVLGGVSGHAGLFSTAHDLALYAQMWLNNGWIGETLIIPPVIVENAIKSYTASLNGNRGLGWVLKGDALDASGDLFSQYSYGHTGFTGTSLWIDPENELFVVLLTNRVHLGRNNSIFRLRKEFHNAVMASVRE
ncbi:serine hydrolase domain-containing protein [Virgibacillus doumboii]|uniref:serine hydrolase domain-containing protein n=1 Tax=Virgibacillus doumboii TaxID=2697503 RepID=UPI0013DFF1E0|nr:serine hydrolase domain-containing protein [Virgibacillus doumboii]